MLAFISYVREDSALVLPLKEGLEKHGIECFMDTETIAPGEVWEVKIRDAITRCDFFVPCFSEHYSRKRSTWMNRELAMALERHRREQDRVGWIVPVLLSGNIPKLSRELDAPLRMLNWVPLTRDRWHVTFERLLAVIMPDQAVRGAGLTELARRFSEGRPNDRIQVLDSLTTMLDLPEALTLLERGLSDLQESVRMRAAALVPQAGEQGAAIVARVIGNPDTSWAFRLSLVVTLAAMRDKAAAAVPAILEQINVLLSERDQTVLPTRVQGSVEAQLTTEYSRSYAAMFITSLGDIGEPAAVIRAALSRIQSDVPEIREAIEACLRKCEF